MIYSGEKKSRGFLLHILRHTLFIVIARNTTRALVHDAHTQDIQAVQHCALRGDAEAALFTCRPGAEWQDDFPVVPTW
jgi:hypothetical protein